MIETMWLLLIAFVLALSFWFYRSAIKPLRYWSNKGAKQTKPWPIFGDFLSSILHQETYTDIYMRLYNMEPNERYLGFYDHYTPVLLIRDPELIKQITIKNFDHFTDHEFFSNTEENSLFSGNLFILKGQRWREMRAILSSSFTSSKMKSIFGLMNETAADFVDYFKDKNENLIELEFKDCFTRYTNDVIATAAFGLKVNSVKEPDNTFYLNGKKMTQFFKSITIIKFLRSFLVATIPHLSKFVKITNGFDADAMNYFRNVIEDTIKTREEKGIQRRDMINLLLEARKGVNHEEKGLVDTGYATVTDDLETASAFKAAKKITNRQIASQALVFFIAGFDTVSTGICFGLYEMALNKNVQDKLRKEIIKTDQTVNGKITYETLLQMKYLDMVVTEVLRKWPPAIRVDRICTKPYTIEPVKPGEKPIHLKIGDVVIFPFHSIHRDSKFYPNPDRFDPERFSSENKDKIVPYTYLPFSSGPRSCIGSRFALLEIKVLLYTLLKNFEIVPTGKTTIPLQLSRQTFANTAEKGFWLGLKRTK